MNRIDRFIVDCSSFEEFRRRAGALPLTKDRGDAFERLTHVYLQTVPEYQSALEKVWLLRDAPPHALAEIGLPRGDLGIDLMRAIAAARIGPSKPNLKTSKPDRADTNGSVGGRLIFSAQSNGTSNDEPIKP